MLKLNLSEQSSRFLNNLAQKQFYQIEKKIAQLKENPLPPENTLLKWKKIQNFIG